MRVTSLFLIICLAITDTFATENNTPETNKAKCSERMVTLLNKHPESVIVHVKGLVCASCGIGIRIGLAKIEGIDRSKFTNGVELDSSNQYVLLATNSYLDFNLIFQKIYDAGYDPSHLCYMKENEVIRVETSELDT